VKHLDDLELLRLICDLETTEPGVLFSGYTLMERAFPLPDRDPQNDSRQLAHELLLARHAELLTFVERNTGQRFNLPSESHNWLQQIGEFALTIKGRDRALGRVIVVPLEDPAHDDGRMILGSTLEEIGRAVGDSCTEAQLPRFLSESGIPVDSVPFTVTGDKWEYCARVMESLLDGGSAARRILRQFIGRWLSDQLQASPSDRVRRRVVELLARQGWRVEEGVLVIGPIATADASVVAPLYRDARTDSLHANIRQVAEPYLDSGHPEVAISEAFKAVNKRVQQLTKLDLDGEKLINAATGGDNPPVRFGDLDTETGRNRQTGYRLILTGVTRAIRNPNSHELFRPLDEVEAFELLGLASMLMRRLDAAIVRTADRA
jgi:uncharacterized protein (TIGR02391 family)